MASTQTRDKGELLQQLKIDREASSGSKWIRWLLYLPVAAILAGGWFYWSASGDLLVTTAVAQPVAAIDTSGDSSVLDASGYITARRIATVSPKLAGRVVEILVEEGMSVAEGQILARLDTTTAARSLAWSESQVMAARAVLGELKVQLKEAQLTLKRTRDLVAKTMASQADLDNAVMGVDLLRARLQSQASQIDVARRRVDIERQRVIDHEITAPFAGVVIAKAAQVGEIISPVTGGGNTNIGVCTIVDMDSLEVEVDVNESYINRVTPDQSVSVMLNAYPDWEIPASVIAIIPTADRSKATVSVRIRLLVKDPRILPDMGVKVSFLTEPTVKAANPKPIAGVLVPSKAIHRDDSGRLFAFVVVDAVVQRRAVRVDDGTGTRKRVTRGLAAGERVVTNLDPTLVASLRNGVTISEQ
jgi:RND family efflux transporter MFP subunit|tara:strand:- start:630 stop:1880 length:1251 start_codon:yes stop_codon:yes gene_type:complete